MIVSPFLIPRLDKPIDHLFVVASGGDVDCSVTSVSKGTVFGGKPICSWKFGGAPCACCCCCHTKPSRSEQIIPRRFVSVASLSSSVTTSDPPVGRKTTRTFMLKVDFPETLLPDLASSLAPRGHVFHAVSRSAKQTNALYAPVV